MSSKLNNKEQLKTDLFVFAAGLLIVIAGLIPYFVLKDRSVFDVLDQLDSDVAEYYMKAKHLFDGSVYFPEYFGGSSGDSVIPTSPGTLLFYVFFDTFKAFFINHILVILSAYLSMYMLLRKLVKNPFISVCCAVIFSYLPFYSIYGLGVAGVPLVVLAFLQFYEKGYKAWYAYINLILYGLFSSLALMGWAVFLLFGIATLVYTVIGIKKRSTAENNIRQSIIGLWTGEVVFGLVYLIVNMPMVKSFFLGAGEESQRSEFVFRSAGESFLNVVTEELVLNNNFWARSMHKYIFFIGIVVLILGFAAWKKINKEAKKYIWILVGIYAFAVGTSVFKGIFESETVIAFRNSLDSGLASFQFERFFYLYPAVWYMGLGVELIILTETGKDLWKGKKVITIAVSLIILAICSYNVLKDSPFKTNLRDMIKPEGSTSLSWEAYYESEEYREVADYILAETGDTQDKYRVGNLGLEPAVAVVNGFYTIDGYSSVYNLSYKHKFRNVIAKELEKNEVNKQYFDEWGNRCYLFSAEYFKAPFLSKYEHPAFHDLELDNEALKNLGCRYLLAAGEITDAEEKGYKLLKIFDRYDYTYFIYLYEVL